MSYSVANVHQVLREALAVFELFRKLGFSADQIYLVINDTRDVVVELHVEDQSGGGVRVGALPPEISREEAFAKWKEIAEHMREVPEIELRTLWAGSMARVRAVQIMTAIRMRGIALPNDEDHESLLN